MKKEDKIKLPASFWIITFIIVGIFSVPVIYTGIKHDWSIFSIIKMIIGIFIFWLIAIKISTATTNDYSSNSSSYSENSKWHYTAYGERPICGDDMGKNQVVADLKNLSENLNIKPADDLDAMAESNIYNTDMATGAQIAQLKNINEHLSGKRSSLTMGCGEPTVDPNDVAKGSVVEGFRELRENLAKKNK